MELKAFNEVTYGLILRDGFSLAEIIPGQRAAKKEMTGL